VADNLRNLPQGLAAVEAGQVGYSHLVHLARTAEKLGSALVESELLEFAKENSPGKLWYRCRYEVHRFDRERELADHNAEDERRFLSLRRQEDGSVLIEGRLDKVGGTAVEVCLRGLARRISADDDRTPQQRLADALAEVSMLAMDSGVVPNRGGTRAGAPHLRLQLHPAPDGAELGAAGRGPGPTHVYRTPAPGAGRPRQRLHLSRMHAHGALVQWASHSALVQRRWQQCRRFLTRLLASPQENP
jgi:hypothetical protein